MTGLLSLLVLALVLLSSMGPLKTMGPANGLKLTGMTKKPPQTSLRHLHMKSNTATAAATDTLAVNLVSKGKYV